MNHLCQHPSNRLPVQERKSNFVNNWVIYFINPSRKCLVAQLLQDNLLSGTSAIVTQSISQSRGWRTRGIMCCLHSFNALVCSRHLKWQKHQEHVLTARSQLAPASPTASNAGTVPSHRLLWFQHRPRKLYKPTVVSINSCTSQQDIHQGECLY